MRIRRKPWAKPELEACSFCIQNPKEMKGKWNTAFKDNTKPVYMELGCGKGGFISQIAPANPDINFFALDIKSEMLGLAKRKLEKAYSEINTEPDNILIMCQNIEMIDTSFGEGDSVDRIYINFCNPWPRAKHKKRRLTHSRQLMKYKAFLKKDGEIRFKTDDDELFEESFEYFKECGFTEVFRTYDLHAENLPDNIVTEHEQMFTDMGKKIKYAVFRP